MEEIANDSHQNTRYDIRVSDSLVDEAPGSRGNSYRNVESIDLQDFGPGQSGPNYHSPSPAYDSVMVHSDSTNQEHSVEPNAPLLEGINVTTIYLFNILKKRSYY